MEDFQYLMSKFAAAYVQGALQKMLLSLKTFRLYFCVIF